MATFTEPVSSPSGRGAGRARRQPASRRFPAAMGARPLAARGTFILLALALAMTGVLWFLVVQPASAQVAPLGPPQNLQAQAGDEEITLTWEAPASDGGSDISGYSVAWSWSAGTSHGSGQTSVNGLSHTITGLTNGVEYELSVAAENADGARARTGTITAAPNDGVPPQLLTASVNASTVILDYDKQLDSNSLPANAAFSVTVGGAARDVTGVSMDANLVKLTLASPATSSDTVSVGYMAPADAAAARIRDPYGNAAPSFDGETASWAVVPGAPLNPSADLPNSGWMEVSWDAPDSDGGSSITAYRVQWKSGQEDYGPSRQADMGASSRSHTIKGLTNGVQYTARVTAVNFVGDGPPSAEVSGTPVLGGRPLRQFIEDLLTDYEADHPWLRTTWDYMNEEPGFDLRFGAGSPGEVR